MDELIENNSNDEYLLNDIIEKITSSLQCPQDDYISKDYQSELANFTKSSNRIIFLPRYEDKLYVSLMILKSSSLEMEKTRKQIIYLIDSSKYVSTVSDFFKKHSCYPVTEITQNNEDKLWNKTTGILVSTSAVYLHALSEGNIKLINCRMIFFDECAFAYGQNSMKQVMNFFSLCNEQDWPRIVAFTSFLLHPTIKADDSSMYKFLKHLEITFKSTIISSRYCSLTKKLLPRVNVKFVKFRQFKENFEDCPYNALCLDTLIGKSIATIDALKIPNNSLIEEHTSFRSYISIIFQDIIRYLYLFGVYPAFVVSNIHRMKLEKVLLCSNATSLISSAVTSDLYVIRSLLWDKLMGGKYLAEENSATILKNSSEKIMKLVSLLHKLEFEGNCIILVNDCTTAKMLTYILQKLSTCETKMSHIAADFIVSDKSVLKSDTDREHSFFKKQLNAVVQRFQKCLLNVLVISWNAEFNINELCSNWIVYFDMAPTYDRYILSRKYASDTNNCNYFFIEETGDENKFNNDKNLLEEFIKLDLNLKELVSRKDLNNEYYLHKSLKTFEETKAELESKFPPLITKHNKRVSFMSAIDAVNKYCKSLPCDGFSSPAPRWSFHKKDGGVICKLRLPIQSGIKTVIENPPIKNVKFVKQIVALEMVKFLYKCGQLNDDLVSTFSNVDNQLNSENLFPNWVQEDDNIEPGSAHCYRTVPLKFPEWFNRCSPQPNAEIFLHVIHLKTCYEEPDESRKLFFHKLMRSNKEFGILSSKKLPQVCEFPVYSDLGQVNVNIEVNAKIIKLSNEEIDRLISCHKFIFLDVLQIVKGFLIADRSNSDNSYCIVPLNLSDDGSVDIAWDAVNDLSVRSEIIEPSEAERLHAHYSVNDFLGKVVCPWYRSLTQRYYIVTKVCTDLTPNTPFPSGEFDTFTEYYHEKYNLEVKQPTQPLLEARIITDNLKCIRPRAQAPGVKKKKGENEPDLPINLLPEFCIRQLFPAVYWYKATLLLGITHRLHYILLAEELRRKVASETSATADSSTPSDEQDILEADESFVKECEEGGKPVIPVLSILKQIKYLRNVRRYPWADEQLPIDLDRQLDTVSMIDVMSYCDFIRGEVGEHPDAAMMSFAPSDSQFPNLKFINIRKSLNPGPKQNDILKTFTGIHCDDIVNLERLKMIGKSFLNFTVSLWLYTSNPDWNVTQLRKLKQKILSRRNLYYCGAKLELGSYVKLHDFSENNDWFLSGFSVPDVLINILKNYVIPPEAIFNLEIPRDEQHSGEISAESRNNMQNKLIEYYDKTSTKNTENTLKKAPISDNGDNNHAIIYFKKHSVPDKAVVSALKSLVGAYLVNTGVESTSKFLQYVGVLSSNLHPGNSCQEDLPSSENYSFFNGHCFKQTLGYEFKNKKLLLEALTHHSYFDDTSSVCYHKLAFLGNAILDLLLTGYVHEYFGDRKINEVREIRVSLMNDVVFAIVAVRIGLHKYLFSDSVKLMEKIDKFVQEESRVGYRISYDELLFLIEETNNAVLDSVDVPRALTDVFKSIIAAIYLDTNGDLKIVWNIVNRALKTEIDKFNDMPPRDPVRLLEETALKFSFNSSTFYAGSNLIIVPLQIEIDDAKKVYFGTGSTKNQAKRLAAKMAFKEMAREFVV